MAHTGFIAASFAVALGGVLGMFVVSFVAMRRAERQAEAMRREQRG